MRAPAAVMAGALSLTLATTLTAAPASAANGGPSASDIARSHAAVAQRERQVANAAKQVAAGQAALDRLTTAAEVAVEAYDKAQVAASAARRNLAAAKLVLATATAQLTGARAEVGRFAAAAYEGGSMSTVDALLTSDGPESMLYRMSTLGVVSREQQVVLQQVSAAEIYQRVVQRQAAAVLTAADAAQVRAAKAGDTAQAAVTRQTATLTGVRNQERAFNALLAQAQAHASALERARLEAIARARAEAAARAAAAAAAAAAARAAAQGAASSASLGDTVSDSTEAGAVRAAESQLGKPYQWGAVGPDSYDCSGLVMWAYAQVGVAMDHWTGDQWNEGVHIALSQLRPGDLIFFATDTSDPNTIHHVGMYVGNGEMVEAPYTGADVRISNAYRPDLIGAVRPFAG